VSSQILPRRFICTPELPKAVQILEIVKIRQQIAAILVAGHLPQIQLPALNLGISRWKKCALPEAVFFMPNGIIHISVRRPDFHTRHDVW
jgi:hypothetical protein